MSKGNSISVLGSSSASAAAGITVGTSVITSGVSGRVLYDNAGVVGELAVPLASSVGGTGTTAGLTNRVFAAASPNAVTVGTAEEVLATVNIPANTLSATKGLRFFAVYVPGAAGNKEAWVRLGGLTGAVLLDTAGPSAYNSGIIILHGTLIVNATSVQYFFGQWHQKDTPPGNANAQAFQLAAPTQTLSGSVDLVFTGLSSTAANLTLKSYFVEIINAPL